MDQLQFGSIMITFSILTCITNGSFLWILWRSKHLQTVQNIMIASLIVTDFAVGVVALPVNILYNFYGTEITKSVIGILLGNLISLLSFVSICHLLAVTIERYYAIIYPLNYSALFTTKKQVAFVVIVWLLTVPYETVYLTSIQWNFHNEAVNGSLNQTDGYPLSCCVEATMVHTVIMFVFVIMLILHIRIFWEAVKQIRKIRSTRLGMRSGFNKEVKAFFVAMVTVYYYGMSFLPSSVLYFCSCNNPVYWFTDFARILAYLNPGVNPLIYGLGFRDTRHAIFKTMCFLKCTRKTQIANETIATNLTQTSQ